MKGNFKRLEVTVPIEDMEVDGLQVTPGEYAEADRKHKGDESEKSRAIFHKYVQGWRNLKDDSGNDIECNEENRNNLFDYDNGLALRMVQEIIAEINKQQRQAEKN